MDFFEAISGNQWRLSRGERALLDYVVRNMPTVRSMSIRELAAACFVSTTSIFRFVKKLGFTGYSEFLAALRESDDARPAPEIPERMLRSDYAENYLKNIIETIRVIGQDKSDAFSRVLKRNPRVFIVADGLSKEIGRYAHYLFTALGFVSNLPTEPFEFHALPAHITNEDLLLVLCYSGENRIVLDVMERVLAQSRPTVVTVTNSENNSVFALGDIDIYVFSDAATYAGTDITSRISMIAALEHLLNGYLKDGAALPEK